MKKEIIATENAPPIVGPYSQAVRAGGFLFVSGQLPIDKSTGELVEENIEIQTNQCLENVKAVLQVAGCLLDDVVKVTVFLVDLNDFEKMNCVYSQYFNKLAPVRCCVQVARLLMDARVEIEATAIYKGR